MQHLAVESLWKCSHLGVSLDAQSQAHLASCKECASCLDLLKELKGVCDGGGALPGAESGCPSEKTLADFIAGSLGEWEAGKVREHVWSCRRCLRVIVGWLGKQQPQTGPIPAPVPPVDSKPPEVAVFVTDESSRDDGSSVEEPPSLPAQELAVEQVDLPSVAPTPSTVTQAAAPSLFRRFRLHLLSLCVLGAVLIVAWASQQSPERRTGRAIHRAEAYLAKGNARDARKVLESAVAASDLTAAQVDQLHAALERAFLQTQDPNELNDAVEKGYASAAVLAKLAKAVSEGKATLRPSPGAAVVSRIVRAARNEPVKSVAEKILNSPSVRARPTASGDRVMSELLGLRAERKGDLVYLQISAKYLVACGLPRDALSRVRSILEKKPEDRAAHEELAAIYWQLGMKQELEDEVRALMRLR